MKRAVVLFGSAVFLGVMIVWVYELAPTKISIPVAPAAPILQVEALRSPSVPQAPVEPAPDPNIHDLTEVQQTLVRELIQTLLFYIDGETRYGCGDKEDSRYFPRQPKIVVSYRKGGFTPKFWSELRLMARMEAPAVTLVPYNEKVAEFYLIDILTIKATTPLASVTYRHSTFNFGSEFDSIPIFGAGQYQKPSNLANIFVTSEARITLNEDGYAHIATLAKGNIHLLGRGEMKSEVKDKPEILDAIGQGIEKFELTLPENRRMASGGWYKKEELEIKAYDYSGLVEPNVVLAVVSTPANLSGLTRLYLLEREQIEWQVVDTVTNTWSDFVVFPPPCKEP